MTQTTPKKERGIAPQYNGKWDRRRSTWSSGQCLFVLAIAMAPPKRARGPPAGSTRSVIFLRGAAEIDRGAGCDQNDLSGRMHETCRSAVWSIADRLLPPHRDCRGKPVVTVAPPSVTLISTY